MSSETEKSSDILEHHNWNSDRYTFKNGLVHTSELHFQALWQLKQTAFYWTD